jgi:hypothetical protein
LSASDLTNHLHLDSLEKSKFLLREVYAYTDKADDPVAHKLQIGSVTQQIQAVLKFGSGFCEEALMQQVTQQPGSIRSRAVSQLLGSLVAIVIALAASAATTTALAQEFRATITGQVADSTGSVIPGAAVSAVDAATGQTYSSKADSQGQYSLLYLLPGSYTVTVTAQNFEAAVFKNLVLESAQRRGLNVTLKAGAVSQEVVVNATGALLDTVSASTGGVIDQVKVENMPSTGREVWDDVQLTPGIRGVSTDPFDITPRNNGNKYSVSGVPSDANAYWVNGAPVSDQGVWYFTPEQDAAQEVQAAANPYDAEYGRTAGGAFNANIKAGTDKYHGSIYDFYGNEALNANFWQSNLNHIRNGLDIRNTFGGTIGGPVIRNKTFFFAGYEGFRQNYPVPAVDSVPPQQWLSGNFQGSGYTIYDPATITCVATNGSGGCTQYSRQPFQNNMIPADRISKIGQAILAMYPAPTAAGSTNNYAIPGARTFSYDQYVARVDQTLTSMTRMYGLFTIQKNGAHNPGNGLQNDATTSSTPTGWDWNIITGFTHIFSPSLVGDAKASYGHYTSETLTGVALGSKITASSLGLTMPPNGSTGYQDIVPEFTMSPYTALFGNTDSGSADADADFGVSLTQTLGRHTLHYGFEFLDVQSATIGIPGTPNGVFTFDQSFTQQNPLKTSPNQGNAIADILLGVPTGGTVTWNSNTFITYHYYGTYAQDTFRLRPNLSLEAGLRWDLNQSPSERHNRMNGDFCLTCTNPDTPQVNYPVAPGLQNPLLGGWTFAGVSGTPRAPFKEQWNDWQPRVGIAWTVMPKTVVRGGYGIFYSWPYINITSNGFSQTTSYVASLDGNLTPANSFFNGSPYPNGVISPTGAAGGLTTQAGQAISYYNTDRAIRKTQHWSAGVQHELPGSVLIDVQYIGSRVSGIPVVQGVDVVSASQQQACLQNPALCTTNVKNPFYGVLAASTSLGASATLPSWELQRSYPLFNGITEQQAPIGKSHYNSGNVRLERQVKSLDFIFNYAYSNWVEQTAYLNNGTQTGGAFRDANLWSGLDPNDQRHYIDANMVYPLPSVHKNGLIDVLLNHWLVDSTFLWTTGSPLAIPSANLSGASGCTSYDPAGGQTRAHWFNNNVSCYQTLSQWQPRTAPLYIGYLRNPSEFYWNPAFHKQFNLPREGMYIRFRMEAVNGANHPTFNGPNETLSTPPSYSPGTSWTGFGTLPATQANAPRAVIASLKIAF